MLRRVSLPVSIALSGVALALGMAQGITHGAGHQASEPRRAHWIWLPGEEPAPEVELRRTVVLDAVPERAELIGTCDNRMTVRVNGAEVLRSDRWEEVTRADVASQLKPGANVIEVEARNDGGPAGLALRLADGDVTLLATDGAWEARAADGGGWTYAEVLGPVGGDVVWSGTVGADAFRVRGEQTAPAQAPERGIDLHLPDGFEAELLYRVPRDQQGSWVSLAKGPDGELYASDQGGKGIFRIEPAPLDDPGGLTSARRIGVDTSGAQGLLWAFDSLYANVYGQGLWRVRDTDDDGRLDRAENLVPLGAGGEHGPHAVLPTADGEGLYFVGGNHVPPPAFEGSRAPSNWGEDLLLPRLWDARGHARGKLAPGGWIARCAPDGTDVEIVSSGYRNHYDIALDPGGELFTYDADMEWDLGSPWYRPTRICHATSGSEFGWRSGTGKWPVWYEDSLPPVLDIGPGSPTGLLFGTGARFPERYQRALFALDWTFGTIYAIHLEPDGASFTATKEEFAWAKPLGVTDAVIGDDGAFYFTVGGRGTESFLYRIVYRGDEPVAPAEPSYGSAEAVTARLTRRGLEAFHGRVVPGAVEAAWPHLGSEDRFIRFAARIAVENQPVREWRDRALAETGPRASTTALIALARQGEPADLPRVADALLRLNLGALPEPVRLAALRAWELAFIRLGAPDDDLRARAIGALDPLMPSGSDAVDLEVARLLTYLRAPSAVAKTLALMARDEPTPLPPWGELIRRNDRYGGPIAKMLADMPPLRDIALALALRNATEGWTMDLRRQYFEFFPRAAQHPGGMSYAGFLENIRADAVDLLPAKDRRALADVLGESLVWEAPIDVEPAEGPGRVWTVDEAVATIGDGLTGRSFAAGRNLFHAASCSRCHRFDGEGGAIGPDLTTAGNKFSGRDLLEAIIEPSAVISDQYASHLVLSTDGIIASGLMVEEGDEVLVYPADVNQEPYVFLRSEIEVIKPSETSQMPRGLVDALNPEELRDLVAYLLAGGDEGAAVFGD